MSLVIVDPRQKFIAADRRITRGTQVFDDFDKIWHGAPGIIISGTGGLTGRTKALAWALESHPKRKPHLWHALHAAHTIQTLVPGAETDCELVLIVEGSDGWGAYSIGHEFDVCPIASPTAFGSGSDAATALMELGVGIETIFPTVAAVDVSVSASYDVLWWRD